MNYFWSPEHCGDTAIVINASDLTILIQEECDKFFFEYKDSFIRHLENIENNNPYFRKFAFAIISSRILDKAKQRELSTPFEHVANKELIKVFLKGE